MCCKDNIISYTDKKNRKKNKKNRLKCRQFTFNTQKKVMPTHPVAQVLPLSVRCGTNSSP